MQLLVDWLREHGKSVITFRDPGSTKLGEALREILLHRQEIDLSPTSEMLLYMASRAQLVSEQLRPSLSAYDAVITDRYLLANVVYQGVAGGMDPNTLWQVGRVATGGLDPDLTIVLDLPVELAAQRIDRTRDRLESRGIEYFRRVREGFLQQHAHAGNRSIVVDATQSIQDIHIAIVDAVKQIV